MSTPHRCHDCQHLTTHGHERAFCAKRHAIRYEFPASSIATDFGFRAVGSCGRSFTPRDASFYTKPAAPSGKRSVNNTVGQPEPQ